MIRDVGLGRLRPEQIEGVDLQLVCADLSSLGPAPRTAAAR
jgi:hypothetical protein